MAAQINLTVKKSDGTTDVIYVALKGSAGDRDAAVWRQDAYHAIQGNRPVYSMMAKPTGNGKRVVEEKLFYPELMTDSTTGITTTRLKQIASRVTTMDPTGTDAAIGELVDQFANLGKHASVLAAVKSGYSPT